MGIASPMLEQSVRLTPAFIENWDTDMLEALLENHCCSHLIKKEFHVKHYHLCVISISSLLLPLSLADPDLSSLKISRQ